MRIGYMCCSPEFEQEYIDNTTINEYSGLSVSFAIKMLENYEYVVKNIELINKEKNSMMKQLEEIGIHTIASDSNTIMSKTIVEDQLVDKLFEEDISLIKVYDEENRIHFRIAVQDKKSNKDFIRKIKKIIKEFQNE